MSIGCKLPMKFALILAFIPALVFGRRYASNFELRQGSTEFDDSNAEKQFIIKNEGSDNSDIGAMKKVPYTSLPPRPPLPPLPPLPPPPPATHAGVENSNSEKASETNELSTIVEVGAITGEKTGQKESLKQDAAHAEVDDSNSEKASDVKVGETDQEVLRKSLASMVEHANLTDFAIDFKSKYDRHFQGYVCDCGKRTYDKFYGSDEEWRTISLENLVEGLYTDQDIDYKNLKAFYPSQEKCLSSCFAQCQGTASQMIGGFMAKWNAARCVRVNDFSCQAQFVGRKGPYWSVVRKKSADSTDNTDVWKSVGGDSMLEAQTKCARSLGFDASDPLGDYYRLKNVPGRSDNIHSVEMGIPATFEGPAVTGIYISFFPWETAGHKAWEMGDAYYYECILDPTLVVEGLKYAKKATWNVAETVPDAECVCWKGCVDMGKKDAFCRKIGGPSPKMPKGGFTPSQFAAALDRLDPSATGTIPTIPPKCK